MKLITQRLALIGVGALWAITSARPAAADDTELFVGTPNNVNTAQPNILFVIDNSVSMRTNVFTQANYDPLQTYGGSCDPTRVYWRTSTGSPPACSTSNYFNKSALFCKAGLQSLAASGIYLGDLLAQYDTTQKKWVHILSTQKTRLVECKADNGFDGDGNPITDVYPKNGVSTAANAWSSTSGQGGFAWGKTGETDQVYTLYDGNYLNYLTGPTTNQTRLQIVQNVATTLLNSLNGVNIGLMTFNYEQGGYVVYPMQDIATSRTNVITAINALTPSTFTPLSETLYEAAQYYMGRAVYFGDPASVPGSRSPGNPLAYLSPIQAECQKNFIILLTDGEPTHDSDADGNITAMVDAKGQNFQTLTGSATCDVETYPAGFNPSGGDCLDDLAQFLYQGDISSLSDRQNVVTYTIGFTVDLENLKKTAARGGGAYYTAGDTASLTNAFTNIVTSILDSGTTFVSPTVAVNSFNRTQNLNDLFISVFKPTGTFHWPGNLKKYTLSPTDATIIDVNKVPAVDAATGFFKKTSQSYWSPAVDGANVDSGGAASRIPPSGVRKVFTYFGTSGDLTASSNRVEKANASITDAVLNTGLPGDPTRDQVIDFMNNLDAADYNQNSDLTEVRDQMGDPLHSQPATVVYAPPQPNASHAVVFFATNDGFLHAIDADSGVEKWAFVPPEFLDTQIQLFLDPSSATKNYGIDGNVRVQILANNDGTIDPAAGERVYLFFGLRRGGDRYYALDVSNPDAPLLKWRLDSTSLPGVGQTWATPVPTRILVGDGSTQNPDRLVLVIGGGYEPDQDGVTTSVDTTGNSIYIVDSVKGTVLWRGSKAGGDKSFAVSGKSMDYSFPADVKVIDFDGDGYADRMYAADMGGQVWRFDIVNGQPAATLVTGGVFAQLGAAGVPSPPASISDTRRFYYAPDVAIVTTKDFDFIHVGIGSGHRAHPLSLSNQDRFYALRDYGGQGKQSQATYDGFTPIKDSDLVDITDNPSATVVQGAAGWRFELRDGGWIGEKVLAESRTFANKIFFTTFRPALSGSSCSPQLGVNRLYEMSLFNGAPVTNLDGSQDGSPLGVTDRYTDFSGSISSEVVFIFPSGDQNCVGDQCTPPPVACVDLFCFPPGFANNPVRTFWSEVNAD